MFSEVSVLSVRGGRGGMSCEKGGGVHPVLVLPGGEGASCSGPAQGQRRGVS